MHFLALLHGVNGPKQSVQNQAHQLKMFLELSLRGNAKVSPSLMIVQRTHTRTHTQKHRS